MGTGAQRKKCPETFFSALINLFWALWVDYGRILCVFFFRHRHMDEHPIRVSVRSTVSRLPDGRSDSEIPRALRRGRKKVFANLSGSLAVFDRKIL